MSTLDRRLHARVIYVILDGIRVEKIARHDDEVSLSFFCHLSHPLDGLLAAFLQRLLGPVIGPVVRFPDLEVSRVHEAYHE